MIKLSVIVPIYNVEKYLINCLQSIEESISEDCEVILINDGSIDSSKAICESYVIDKPNFKLVNQENRGVSSARNTGMRYSKGEYISFIDSDDWISKEYFKIILENLTSNPDVLVFGYTNINENTDNNHEYEIDNKYFEKDKIRDAVLYLESNEYAFNLIWNKIYKKSKVLSYFQEGVNYGEDLLFNCEFFKCIDTAKTISDLIYYYRTSNNSLTNNKFYENYDDLMHLSIEYRKQLYDFFDLLKKDGDEIFFQKCLELYLASITNMYRVNSTFRFHQRIEKLKSIKQLIQSSYKNVSHLSENEKLCLRIITKYPSYISDFVFILLFFIKNKYSFFYYKFVNKRKMRR